MSVLSDETRGYLDVDGTGAYVVVHHVASRSGAFDAASSVSSAAEAGTRLGVVIVPPIFDEAVRGERLLVLLARALRARGFPVVRVHPRGQGESEGAFAAHGIATRREDIARAIALCRAEPGVGRVVLAGLELGGLLAAHVAEARSDIAGLVLVDPPLSGDAAMRALLRKRLASQLTHQGGAQTTRDELLAQIAAGGTVLSDGYTLSNPLVAELTALKMSAPAVPTLMLATVKNAAAPPPESLRKLVGPLPEPSAVRAVACARTWLDGRDHDERSEALIGPIVEWVASLPREPAQEPPEPSIPPTTTSPGGERVVSFRSGAHELAGTFHPARGRAARAAVVVHSFGTQPRSNMNLVVVSIARALAEAGCDVLRYDAHGVGESEGEIAPDLTSLRTVWGRIETGQNVDDALAASRAMRRLTKASPIVHCGLCGGAATGIQAAAKDEGTYAMLIAPTVIVSTDEAPALTYGESEELATDYVRKLLDPQAWKRLLGGQSDKRLLLASFVAAARRRVDGALDRVRRRRALLAPGDEPAATVGPPVNLRVVRAMRKYLEGRRRMLLLYPGNDPLQRDFEDTFAPRFLPEGHEFERQIDRALVPDANHAFQTDGARERLIHELVRWLDTWGQDRPT